jgi:hypothetical protein
LRKSILALSNASITLLSMERELARAQPMLVRAAVFDLLRTGALAAPSLQAGLTTAFNSMHWTSHCAYNLGRTWALIQRS